MCAQCELDGPFGNIVVGIRVAKLEAIHDLPFEKSLGSRSGQLWRLNLVSCVPNTLQRTLMTYVRECCVEGEHICPGSCHFSNLLGIRNQHLVLPQGWNGKQLLICALDLLKTMISLDNNSVHGWRFAYLFISFLDLCDTLEVEFESANPFSKEERRSSGLDSRLRLGVSDMQTSLDFVAFERVRHKKTAFAVFDQEGKVRAYRAPNPNRDCIEICPRDQQKERPEDYVADFDVVVRQIGVRKHSDREHFENQAEPES